MGYQPEHPNNPAYSPSPWAECEWDQCLTLVYENEEGAPFCYEHYLEQLREEAAETQRTMQKEDEI